MDKTHVTLIIDESGSMAGQKQDTIKGLEAYFNELREDRDNEYVISVVKFNNYSHIVMSQRPVEEVRVSDIAYFPGGGTALLDAVGDALNRIPLHRSLGPEREIVVNGESFMARPISGDKNLVVIITDGQENASSRFKNNAIKGLIEDRTARPNWAFLFLGADPSLWDEANNIGIARYAFVNTQGYDTGHIYRAAATSTAGFGLGAVAAMDMGGNMAGNLEIEKKKRKGQR